MATQTDLFNLIFREILKINPSLLYKYTTVQDQVLYLILIPTVILLLFIVAFARGIVGRILGEHRGFQYLVSIVVYIYLVYSGIFGIYLVPIFTTWLNIAIVTALILFIISVVIHPARGASLMKLGTEAGKGVGERLFEKEKKRKAIEDEIKRIDKEIKAYRKEITPMSEPYIKTTIGHLEAQKKSLKHELSKL